MKKLLLATTLAVFLSIDARAQVATFDAANALAEAKAFVQQLKDYGQQLASYEQDLRAYVQYAQTAQQALNIANGLIHNPTNLGGYETLAGMAGVNLQSTLPLDPYALMGLTSGYSGASLGGLMGKLNNLTSLTGTNTQVNAVNTCTANTFACQMQTQRQQASAGQQAAAQQIMEDMGNHLQVLNNLKTAALTTKDQKDAADVNNRIGLEVAAIQADTAQLAAVKSMADAQATVFDNRAAEWVKGQNTLSTNNITAAAAPAPAAAPGG